MALFYGPTRDQESSSGIASRDALIIESEAEACGKIYREQFDMKAKLIGEGLIESASVERPSTAPTNDNLEVGLATVHQIGVSRQTIAPAQEAA